MQKVIEINTIPSPTWSWLKMNKASLEADVVFEAKKTDVIELPNVVQKTDSKFNNSLHPLLGKNKSSAGNALQEIINSTLLEAELFTVPEKTKLTEPVVLKIQSDGNASVNRQVIVAKEDSESTFIFLYEGNAFFVSNTIVGVEKNARVHIVKANLTGKNATFVDDTSFCSAEQSESSFTCVQLGSSNVYSALNVSLLEYKAKFNSNFGYFCSQKQNLDMNHTVLHFGTKTECKMRVNGTLCEDSKKTYRGTIDFKCGCSGSSGDEQEETLLLSPTAVNNSIPVILCDEEDVAGEHGASIGRISDEILFYMQTRGISKEAAENILARAKVQSVVSLIQHEQTKQQIENYLDEVFADE